MGGLCQAQRHRAAIQNRRFDLSPIDALIDLKVGRRLRCHIPIGLNVHPVIRLRIAVIPQRRPACLRNINPTPALEEADREWLLPVSRRT